MHALISLRFLPKLAAIFVLIASMLLGIFINPNSSFAGSAATSIVNANDEYQTLKQNIKDWHGFLANYYIHLRSLSSSYGPYGFVLDQIGFDNLKHILNQANASLRQNDLKEARKLLKLLESSFDQYDLSVQVQIDRGDLLYLQKELIPKYLPALLRYLSNLESQGYDISSFKIDLQNLTKRFISLKDNWPNQTFKGHTELTRLVNDLYKFEVKLQDHIATKDERQESLRQTLNQWLSSSKKYFEQEQQDISKAQKAGLPGAQEDLDFLVSKKPLLNQAIKAYDQGNLALAYELILRLDQALFTPWSSLAKETVEYLNQEGQELSDALINAKDSIRVRLDSLKARGVDTASTEPLYQQGYDLLVTGQHSAAIYCSTWWECGDRQEDKQGAYTSGLNEQTGYNAANQYASLRLVISELLVALEQLEKQEPKKPVGTFPGGMWLFPGIKFRETEVIAGHYAGLDDFNQLFTSAGKRLWADARADTKVIILGSLLAAYPQEFRDLDSHEKLGQFLNEMKKEGMKLAMYESVFTGDEKDPNAYLYRARDMWEYGGVKEGTEVVKRLGMDVEMVFLDSSFSKGMNHPFNHTPEEVAREMGTFANLYKTVHPGAKFCEAINVPTFSLTDVRRFVPLLKKYAPDVNCVTLDINAGHAGAWSAEWEPIFDWKTYAVDIENYLQSEGFKVIAEFIPQIFPIGYPPSNPCPQNCPPKNDYDMFMATLNSAGMYFRAHKDAGSRGPDAAHFINFMGQFGYNKFLPDNQLYTMGRLSRDLMHIWKTHLRGAAQVNFEIVPSAPSLAVGQSARLRAYIDLDGPGNKYERMEVTDWTFYRSNNPSVASVSNIYPEMGTLYVHQGSTQPITITAKFAGFEVSKQVNIVQSESEE